MVSRLNIGPDGGPYIAINENSGDIELEDNSGNVVAKWDETNTQWDFSSNDVTNINTASISSLGQNLDADGSDVTGVGGLEAESIHIESWGEMDFIGEDSGSKDTLNVDVGTSDYRRILVLFTMAVPGNETLELVLDGNDSNGDYEWTYNDDTKTDGKDVAELVERTGGGSRLAFGKIELIGTTTRSPFDYAILPDIHIRNVVNSENLMKSGYYDDNFDADQDIELRGSSASANEMIVLGDAKQ